jgi:hypothetical protein
MIRFSLASLLLGIFMVAMWSAAISQPTAAWAQAVYTCTAVMLITSTIGAVYAPAAMRPFFGGCAVAGWIYFFLCGLPHLPGRDTPYRTVSQAESFRNHLLTTRVVSLLFETIHNQPDVPSPEFYAIGQTGWVWIFAAAGGVFATLVGRAARREKVASDGQVP